MTDEPGEFVVIEAGPAQVLVAEVEAERLDEMQFGAGIGAHADDVAGIGRNFRMDEDDGEHGTVGERQRRRLNHEFSY